MSNRDWLAKESPLKDSHNIIGRNSSMVIPLIANQDLMPMLDGQHYEKTFHNVCLDFHSQFLSFHKKLFHIGIVVLSFTERHRFISCTRIIFMSLLLY